MKKLTKKQIEFLNVARAEHGLACNKLTRTQILEVCTRYGMKEPQWLIKPQYRTETRGEYYLPTPDGRIHASPVVLQPAVKTAVDNDSELVQNVINVTQKKSAKTALGENVMGATEVMIPTRDKNYVKFGIYKRLHTIIASRQFYPVFITGLSGNGKSFTPEQICAELKREFVRVNITKQTNEDDLLGGFRLENGSTVWKDGPVTEAALRGAVLLLDEVDYGSAEITCMQNVLEGKKFLLKKIGRIVTPKEGFTIIATANTKGQGDNAGKFVFTNVLNEAFLERFAVTLEQDYPKEDQEKKILQNYCRSLGMSEEDYGDFPDKLVVWAKTNRETYKKGGINEVLSTRRLVHIVKAFGMFKDRREAVEICLNRFDDETKSTLLDLYKKIDAVPVNNNIGKSAVNADPTLTPEADGGVVF